MKIDLNSIVNVELTDEGRDEAIDYYYEMMRYAPIDPEQDFELKRNKDGTYSFKLDEFMQIFGGYNAVFLEDKIKSIDIVPAYKKNHTVKVRRKSK